DVITVNDVLSFSCLNIHHCTFLLTFIANATESLMEAKERVIEKAVQLERQHQQQQRDVLRQQEREMVMEKSRDREFGD
ncbi:hypothetical protein, partial [Providencia rettgeri]|uniref:hypothetical protein n=2 Tax=Providencia TaxID=586 RepID=UPI002361C0B4